MEVDGENATSPATVCPVPGHYLWAIVWMSIRLNFHGGLEFRTPQSKKKNVVLNLLVVVALLFCENCAQKRAALDLSEPPCHFEWKPRSFSLHQPWRLCAPGISTTWFFATNRLIPGGFPLEFFHGRSWSWSLPLPSGKLTELWKDPPFSVGKSW